MFAGETNWPQKLSLSLIGSIVYLQLVFSQKRTTVGQGARHKEMNEQARCRTSRSDIGGLYH
ncbi:hypothetical protein EMIT0P44_160113 [Pseudomonas sp. IT-P44]